MPERAVAEGLVEALDAAGPRFARVLVARAAEGRDVLIDALRERGSEVDVVALYETVAGAARRRHARGGLQRRLRALHVRVVRALLRRGGWFARRTTARLDRAGDVSAALRELGAAPDLEADPHTPDGLVAALLADAVTSAT